MAHRFVQIGDLHLLPGPRNEDRLAALDQVIAAGEALPDLAGWFWPGDLNHAKMSIEDRNALVARAIRMAARGPVVVVRGNHDFDGDLDFLAKLDTQWPIYVVTRPEVLHIETAGVTEVALFCLPYPSKAGLVGAGVSHEELHAAAVNALDPIFMAAGAELAAARAHGALTMTLGHVNISGAVSSVGQPQIGQELEVTLAHLARLGPGYKGFNHIHKHQRLGAGEIEAWYAGSICRLDWGEVEPKGYLVITVSPDDDGWRHEIEFCPVVLPPMYHVEGTLTRDAFDWRVTRGVDGPEDAAPSDWTGSDVRVRMRYATAEREVLTAARDRVAQIFAGARRLELEPMAVSTRELRAPEVVQATTLPDKLRAWGRLTGVSWTAEIDRCAAQLLAVEEADVLAAEVEARLGPLADLSTPAEARGQIEAVRERLTWETVAEIKSIEPGQPSSVLLRDTLF